MQLVTSGVRTNPAPPATASRTRVSVTGRFSAGSSVTESWRRAARIGSGRKQQVELAGPVECVKIVRSADMAFADEDLRHGPAAAGTLHHLGPHGRIRSEERRVGTA